MLCAERHWPDHPTAEFWASLATRVERHWQWQSTACTQHLQTKECEKG